MPDSVEIKPPLHDPIASTLSSGDNRIILSDWLPPRDGIAPHIRIGRRWFNLLWTIPIGAAGLVLLIALAQSLRDLSGIQAFIKAYPGIAQSAPSVDTGFPWWLQLQHFLNMLFMMFIMRAGIQILADHPRLYWNRDCTPGTEWFRFQHPVPKGRIWTAKDDAVTLPSWLGIPGLRHTIGLARWWHFSMDLLWVLNGTAFYILLFMTNQWLRLVPVTWDVFPNALSTAIQYASLNFPVDHSWTRYNGLQKLSYFITVFIAAPVSITTGLLQSPAISNRLGLLGSILNRPLDPFHLVRLVRVVHPGARNHGVHHRHPGEHKPHVRRGAQRGLGGLSAIRPRYGTPWGGVVGRIAVHDPARSSGAEGRALHGRLDQGVVGVVGAYS
jgi:sulfoxide reductase catalytic subunit YedY